MSTQLSQIAKKAKLDRTVRFTSLAHLLTPEFLTETWGMTNRCAVSGIDGKITEQFDSGLNERAVARIIEAVFEADFLDCSYGFRPGRNPHHALRALRLQIVSKKVNHVFEADIRSYFTRISHRWLPKMVSHRMPDPTILKLIGKWLKAGAMVDGALISTRGGTPQGGPISPVLRA